MHWEIPTYTSLIMVSRLFMFAAGPRAGHLRPGACVLVYLLEPNRFTASIIVQNLTGNAQHLLIYKSIKQTFLEMRSPVLTESAD